MAGAALIPGLESQASAVICSIGLSPDSLQPHSQLLVQDSVASPPRVCRTLVSKRTKAVKGRGRRRRPFGSEDEDSFDSGGGNGGSSNNGDNWGGGSSDWWSWSDEDWWWWKAEAGRMVLSFLYQVACWVCLLECLHFLVKGVVKLSQGGGGGLVHPA